MLMLNQDTVAILEIDGLMEIFLSRTDSWRKICLKCYCYIKCSSYFCGNIIKYKNLYFYGRKMVKVSFLLYTVH